MVEVVVANCKQSAGDHQAEGVLLVAIVESHPEHIDGPWIVGFVLDRHVISSRPIGYAGEHVQFDTTRSSLGEVVYQLKYRNGQLADIVETAVAFATERWGGSIDCVVPRPHRWTGPGNQQCLSLRESPRALECKPCPAPRSKRRRRSR